MDGGDVSVYVVARVRMCAVCICVVGVVCVWCVSVWNGVVWWPEGEHLTCTALYCLQWVS